MNKKQLTLAELLYETSAKTLAELLNEKDLDFDVCMTDVWFGPDSDEADDDQMYNIPGMWVTYRPTSKLGRPIGFGVVRSKYHPIPNRTVFKFVQYLQDFELVGAYSVDGGRQCVLNGRFTYSEKIGEVPITMYLFVLNSHDGSAKFTIRLVPTLVIGNKPCVLNIASNKDVFKAEVMHMVNADANLDMAEQLMVATQGAYASLKSAANEALAIRYAPEGVEDVIKGILEKCYPCCQGKALDARIRDIHISYRECSHQGTGLGVLLGIAKYIQDSVLNKASNQELLLLQKCIFDTHPLLKAACQVVLGR